MEAVLDTNVLISALLFRGAPYQCLVAAEAGLYTLVSAEPILEELEEKLVSKFKNTRDQAAATIEQIRRVSRLVTITSKTGWILADPDDDKFVEAAIVSHSDFIVSGDHHLIDLGVIEGIPVIKPRQLLDKLNEA